MQQLGHRAGLLFVGRAAATAALTTEEAWGRPGIPTPVVLLDPMVEGRREPLVKYVDVDELEVAEAIVHDAPPQAAGVHLDDVDNVTFLQIGSGSWLIGHETSLGERYEP